MVYASVGVIICAIGFLFSCFMLFRNKFVYKARMKENSNIYNKAIKDNELGIDTSRAWDKFNALSYGRMMLQFTKWTHKQFYK